MSRIRFQLDEHMPNAVARELRRRGIDAQTATEAGLRGIPDAEILARSFAAGRVVVTQDDDYLKLHRDGQPHAGIAYCGKRVRSVGQYVEGLTLICEVMDSEEMANWLEYL